MGPDDCEDCCSTCCCLTCGTICCCRPMRKTTRIKILWIWLIVLSVTCAVILGCVVYAPYKLLASPSDMIPIRNHVHFLFCEEVEIDSPGLEFNGYVISGDLEIDPTQTRYSSKSTALFLEERNYNYMAFYLLEGSKLTVHHCAKMAVTFTVIIGRANFESFKKYEYCIDCYYEQSFLQPHSSCDDDEKYDSFSLEAIIEDEYYVIYSNDNYKGDWIDLNIELDHTIYKMQNASTSCMDTTMCNIILSGPADNAVIWVMDYNYDRGENNHPEFSVKCVPRIWAYLLIHGFPILLIGVCLSILIQKTCSEPEDNSLNIQSERTPLLYNSVVLPPSYSNVYLEPPKYEDIIRTYDPPPYSAAIAGLETGQFAPTFYTGADIENNVTESQPQSVSLQNESVSRPQTTNSVVTSQVEARAPIESHAQLEQTQTTYSANSTTVASHLELRDHIEPCDQPEHTTSNNADT